MSKTITIDFGRLGGPVFAGRPKGEKVRAELGLDAVDEEGTRVEVLIPEDIYSLNNSYFLGLFGKSVVHAGTREKFYAQYHFTGPEFALKEVDAGIDRALIESKPL
jgi:hypothetical protein